MKIKLLCTTCCFFLFFDSPAQTFQKIFTYSGIFGPQDSYSTSMQLTNDSGYVVVATTFIFGIGQWEILLIKTDSDGNLNWIKNLGAGISSSVQQTSDGGYIIGGSSNDMLLIKTDASGNLKWSVSIGDSLSTENCYSVEQTNDKGYILTGYTDGFGALYHDIYLVKTDSIGVVVWTKTFSSGNGAGYSIHQTTDGGFILAGSSTGSIGDYDMCLIKIDSIGNTTWRKDIGTSHKDEAYCVQETNDGGFIVSGYITHGLSNPENIALIKTDNNGNIAWSKEYSFGSNPYDVNTGAFVQQLSDNGYAIFGYSDHFSNGIPNLCLFRTDSVGIIEWSKLYKGALGSENRFSCLRKTSDNGFIMASSLFYTLSGRTDIYLVKTDGMGNSGCHDSSVTLLSGAFLASYISPSTESFGGVSIPYPITVDSVGLLVNTLCTTVGIQEIINNISFSISPNPATDKITISFPAIAEQTITTKIFSITGSVVFEEENKTVNNYFNKTIDVKDFSNGIYIIKAYSEKEAFQQKLIIAR